MCGLTEAAYGVHLTIEKDPSSHQTISWRNDVPEAALVEYEDEAGKIYFCLPEEKSYIIEDETIYFYTARLENLPAGAFYQYRIKRDNEILADGSFRTANNGSKVKFLLFGDSQSTDYAVWGETLEQAMRYHGKAADFIVNVGDLVDNGSLYGEWRRWFSSGAGILENVRLVPVVGNHETFAAEYAITHGFCMPRLFTEQFALPQNGPEGLKEQAYSFDYNDLHVAVLDTQFREERAFVADAWEKQLAWLERDLMESRKKWKLVFMHKPPYHNRSDIAPPDAALTRLDDILQRGGARAVFTGHDHVLARTTTKSGLVYMAAGRSGTKTSPRCTMREWNEWFFNPLVEPVYLVVTLDEERLNVEVYGRENRCLAVWQLAKQGESLYKMGE